MGTWLYLVQENNDTASVYQLDTFGSWDDTPGDKKIPMF